MRGAWLAHTLCSVTTIRGRRDRGNVRTAKRAPTATSGEWIWMRSKWSERSIRRRRNTHRGSHDDRAPRQRTGRQPAASTQAARSDFPGRRYATAGATRPGSRWRACSTSSRSAPPAPSPLISQRTVRGGSIRPSDLWAGITLGSILNLEGKPNLPRRDPSSRRGRGERWAPPRAGGLRRNPERSIRPPRHTAAVASGRGHLSADLRRGRDLRFRS